MKLKKLIFLIAFFPIVAFCKDQVISPNITNPVQINSINNDVAQLELKISKSDISLPSLNIDYNFYNATEGVPPSFKFYFERKKSGSDEKMILRVCKIHVGHEVFSIDYIYYFDELGAPLKYLQVDSGVNGEPSAPASREGIIYGKDKKIIWSSKNIQPKVSFQEITSLFTILDKNLKKF
jgi:hypothetical protein